MAGEALRDVQRRREERDVLDEASSFDWELVEEAVEKKQWEVVRWVLRQGAIVDIDKQRGGGGKTLLHDACHGGDLETVKMLCQEMGADVRIQNDEEEWEAVHWACAGGCVDVVRFLLAEGGADVESNTPCWGSRPLHVGLHSLPVVRCLVEEFGVEVDAANSLLKTPLHCAAGAGNVPCMRYLLERGASLDARTRTGMSVLSIAAGAKSAEALRFLVEECGCDPLALEEEERGDLLEHAARLNSPEVFQYLAEECGVPLDAPGHSGESLLSVAVASGALAVAEYLVQQWGISAEVSNANGLRPLHDAALRGLLSMVKWLVQQCGVDVEAEVLVDGKRAVHLAAGDLPVLRFLIEEGGAEVNAQSNTRGLTALHVAAGWGEMECIKFLVEEADADVLLENWQGERPSQTAAAAGQDGVAAYLQDAEEMVQMQKNPE